MRYRPFGSSGAAVSSLTLSLGSEALSRGAAHLRELIFSALEAGVNAYHLENANPALVEIAGEALSHVDRKLLCVSLTLGSTEDGRSGTRDFSADGLRLAIEAALHASGLGWLDVAVLEQPAEHELPQASLTALKALQKAGQVRLLGIMGDDPVLDTYISTGAFKALYTPFHVNVEWQIRARMRAALERDMAIFTYNYFPASLSNKRTASIISPKKGLFGFVSRKADAEPINTGAFGFLHDTNNWAAEDICLAFTLTDPSIASVIIRPSKVAQIESLAAVPERDLPPGLSAQIEMARVNPAS